MSFKETIIETTSISDIPFAEYNQRQLYEVTAGRNRERAISAKPSGNFYYVDNCWHPNEYEGYAVITMLSDNDKNEPLTARISQIQTELHYNLTPRHAFYLLPPESFHQTVANTLSAGRFKEHILNAGLVDTFPAMVGSAFNKIDTQGSIAPIKMKMVGLSIFGTAIGMLGVFENERDYGRITHFRTGFYGNADLAKLDVKMTRPFIGHVTIGYIEHELTKNQKEHLASVVNEINESLNAEENYFYISSTDLRRYHHLAEYKVQDNYPSKLL